MPVVITGEAELRAHVGQELGVSDWHRITQEEVDRFADVTGDHQWIHVDVERARKSDFGGTIVHGYFTLALGPRLQAEVYRFEGFAFGLNYGVDRVRFPAPLPVGERVRGSVLLASVEAVGGGVQAKLVTTFQREGQDKPVCVAESLVRLYPGADEGASDAA